MAEQATAPNPTSTPLALLLATESGDVTLGICRGALTPTRLADGLDAAGKELSQTLFGAAVHDLGWMRRVAVRGEDRVRWLNGMVTNSVNDLAENAGNWNLVLNAQGRIQGDLHLWREGSDALEMEIAANQHQRLLAHLDRFIIMDDVELVPLSDQTALGLSGSRAGEVLARLGLPKLAEPLTSVEADWQGTKLRLRRGYGVLTVHYELWVEAAAVGALWTALNDAGAAPVGAEAVETLRILEAIPEYEIDIMERDLPQETAQMRALNFSKGCYLGQEIVERIRSRGNVHRHLRQLELDGPPAEAGTEVHFENAAGVDAVGGVVTSAVELPLGTHRRIALGMIRAEAELRGTLTYTCGEARGTVRILATPPSLET
jgi:folate-binding protein YgfZ